jgi:chemotaxis protein methyltransferase CheR
MAVYPRPAPLPTLAQLGGAVTALSPTEFRRVTALARDIAGIDLKEGKEALVSSRVSQRVRALGLPSTAAYFAHLDGPHAATEMPHLIDVLTTNKTSFFREPQHFRFLEEYVLPAAGQRATPFRVWSAACSSGEEPYTLAMIVRDLLGDERAKRIRIRATDISHRILARAASAVYRDEVVADVPVPVRARHFERLPPSPEGGWRVVAATRALVEFGWCNLINTWPAVPQYDLIICRNVMIYFDRDTQERLVNRFARQLAPGGYLFVGHAESLSNIRHPFKYIQPAVYRLTAGGAP